MKNDTQPTNKGEEMKAKLEIIEELLIDLDKLEHTRRNTADIEYIEGWNDAKETFFQLLAIYKKEIQK